MLFSERTHSEMKGKFWLFLAVQKLSLWGTKVVVYFDDGKALTFSWCKFYFSSWQRCSSFFMLNLFCIFQDVKIVCFSWLKLFHFFMVAVCCFLSITLCCTTWFSALFFFKLKKNKVIHKWFKRYLEKYRIMKIKQMLKPIF